MLRKMLSSVQAVATMAVAGMPSPSDVGQMLPREARGRRHEVDLGLSECGCGGGGGGGTCMGHPLAFSGAIVGNDGCVIHTATQERVIKWEDVAGYENPDVVHRFESKLGLTYDEALVLFEDTKKFLFLCASNPQLKLSPPAKVDDGWHHFLMYTRDYAAFCQRYFGTMMHHEPNRIGVKPTGNTQTKRAVDVVREVFGQVSPNWGNNFAAAQDRCDGSACASTACGCTSGG